MIGKCCGQERDTTFCPDCGKQLQYGVLEELLIYLRKNKKMTETALKRWQRLDYESEIRQTQNRIARWQRWIEAVEGVIVEKKHGT